ncbi:MAG: DUF3108 domain-containing protein [Thiobacillus sp.]|nr:DUF3108 domain-containing protein [Thiobacillus sp.]
MNIRLGLILAGLVALAMPGSVTGIEAWADTGSRSQAMAPLRSLPAQSRLVYDVLAGKDGLKLGQAVYTWRVSGERYRLESVAEAQGVASLFMSGRIVQTSEGRIGSQGLIPELYAQTKREKPKGTARFDWDNRRLVMSRGTEALAKGTQDLLSFPFHLALTVAEDAGAWQMPVTNGRYLKHYRFKVTGWERLQVGKRGVDTLHVRGSRSEDENLDVWLAPSREWLPLRIRTEDEKGLPIEMKLAS